MPPTGLGMATGSRLAHVVGEQMWTLTAEAGGCRVSLYAESRPQSGAVAILDSCFLLDYFKCYVDQSVIPFGCQRIRDPFI